MLGEVGKEVIRFGIERKFPVGFTRVEVLRKTVEGLGVKREKYDDRVRESMIRKLIKTQTGRRGVFTFQSLPSYELLTNNTVNNYCYH